MGTWLGPVTSLWSSACRGTGTGRHNISRATFGHQASAKRKRVRPPVFTIAAILVILSVGTVALISWGAFREEARNG